MRTATTRLKFPRLSLQLILPLVATAWLAAPSICHATVMLTYTGNDFTNFTNLYKATDKVTVSITLATPLGDNLNLAPVTPLMFSLNDGVGTIRNTDPPASSLFEFSTDSSGNITGWDVNATEGSPVSFFQITTENATSVGTTDNAEISNTGSGTSTASNTNKPGAWTTATAAVPEPSTVSVLGAGVLGLGLLWWRRRQNRDLR